MIKANSKIKIIIDIAMTAALMFMMGYQIWGGIAHEAVGTALLALFIIHHILNAYWYKSLFKTSRSSVRIFSNIIDILLLIDIILLMTSGIMMSKYIFSFLTIDSGLALARKVHIFAPYWGFVLMSLHIGLHWNLVISAIGKKHPVKKTAKIVLFIIGLAVALFGLTTFITHNFLANMFLMNDFAYMDYSGSPLLFYIDYLCIMGFWIFVSYFICKAMREHYSKHK